MHGHIKKYSGGPSSSRTFGFTPLQGTSTRRAGVAVFDACLQPVPLHEQVAAEIRRAIAEGEATQGERLPPAVDLATVLGVNKNTVIRALHILRDEGLLDFTRGRGVRVVGSPQRGAVMARIDELLDYARTQGYRRDEVLALIQAHR